jgi:outer membrane protein assembly factor BamE (lipoprotein component of BamABCDE complex)
MAILLNALRVSRVTAVMLVVTSQMTACGDGARLYHAFREKTDRVRVGMAESEVRTIMGAPSNSPRLRKVIRGAAGGR